MSKSKYGPALFEVIRSSEPKEAKVVGPTVAPWGDAGKSENSPTPEPVPSPATSPNLAPSQDLAPAIGPAMPGVRWLEVDGGRLRLSLGTVSGATVVFAVCVLIATAYSLGSRSGRNVGRHEGYQARNRELSDPGAPGVDEIAAARNKPIDRQVFNGIGPSPITTAAQPAKGGAAKSAATVGGTVTGKNSESAAANASVAAPSAAGSTGWVKGRTYVAVQHFQESRDDAVRAQQFLKDNGIETEVVEIGKRGKFTLIATRGFDKDDPAQKAALDQYWKRIQSIGQAYSKAGGRYKLEGQLMTLVRDQW